MKTPIKRHRVVVDDTALAKAIGGRIRHARHAAGLTQAALAGDRYTKAYISALENGLAKPSMSALEFLAPRLGTTASALLADRDPMWERVQADLAMASGAWLDALDRYVALADDAVDRAATAGLSVAIAECLCRLDRGREAVRPAAEAAEAYRALGREGDVLRAEYWLASAQYQSDNLEEARSIVANLLDRVRAGASADADFRVRLLVSAAMIETSAGRHATALAYLEEARGLSADLDARRRAALLSALSTASREAGDLEGAIRHGQEAVTLMRAAEADDVTQYLVNDLAMAYLANGNMARARELAAEARTTAARRADDHLHAHAADTEAMIALAAGDPERAIELADEAIDLAQRADNSKARLEALITRARAEAALGDHEAAAADFELAAQESVAWPARRREAMTAWADSLAALGQHDRAFALVREAMDPR